MNKIFKHITLNRKRWWPIFLIAGCQLSIINWLGCQMIDENDFCCYNVQLNYRYYHSGKNELTSRITSMRHFLFNADSILQDVYDVSGDAVKKLELIIPSGDYTIISFANIHTASRLQEFVTGQSRMDELQLYIDNLNEDGYQNNSEKLFFAYRNFSVAKSGIKYYIVDCTHAHNILTVNVKWKDASPPVSSRYTMELTKVPGNYQFPVQRWITIGSFKSEDNKIPESNENTVVHAIPEPLSKTVTHHTEGKFKPNGNLEGTFITYRYTNQRIPTFCLFGDNEALMKEIDLSIFFQQMGWELSNNIEQEFDLTMTIDGDKVWVSGTNIVDWEDGGTIGGGF